MCTDFVGDYDAPCERLVLAPMTAPELLAMLNDRYRAADLPLVTLAECERWALAQAAPPRLRRVS